MERSFCCCLPVVLVLRQDFPVCPKTHRFFASVSPVQELQVCATTAVSTGRF